MLRRTMVFTFALSLAVPAIAEPPQPSAGTTIARPVTPARTAQSPKPGLQLQQPSNLDLAQKVQALSEQLADLERGNAQLLVLVQDLQAKLVRLADREGNRFAAANIGRVLTCEAAYMAWKNASKHVEPPDAEARSYCWGHVLDTPYGEYTSP